MEPGAVSGGDATHSSGDTSPASASRRATQGGNDGGSHDDGSRSSTASQSQQSLQPQQSLTATQRQLSRPLTRLQRGIRKEKVYTDGTVRYNLLAASAEPQKLDEAFSNQNWKNAMDLDYSALLKNRTWHLVPPSKEKCYRLQMGL